MTHRPRKAQPQRNQQRFDWSLRSNQLRDVFRDLRLKDHVTRWLLAYIDNRIGGEQTSWGMTIDEIVEETQLSRSTVYDRLSILRAACIISVDDVPNRPGLKRFTISRANINELANSDLDAVRDTDKSVHHTDSSVRHTDYTSLAPRAPSAHGEHGALTSWTIEASEFQQLDLGLARYEEAVHFGWVEDTDANRLNWLCVWVHLGRRHAEGAIRNPGAALTARLKSDPQDFTASNADEEVARKFLRQRWSAAAQDVSTLTAGLLMGGES